MTPDDSIQNPVRKWPLKIDDAFYYRGVLAALSVVHDAGLNDLHDQIVGACGRPAALLEVAKKGGQLRASGMTAWKARHPEWKS
jgi:hypothetical protein